MQPNEQTPTQPSPSQPLPPTQPPVSGSSTARIIQPLSSEDSIRQQVEDLSPALAGQESHEKTEAFVTNDIPTGMINSYESNLSTKPIQRPQQPSAPHVAPDPTPIPTPTSKKRRKTPLIVALCSMLILIAGVSSYVYVLADKVSSDDLVEETYKSTTYLRPKQWDASQVIISDRDISSYGDWIGSDKSKLGSAAVIVKETPSMALLSNADDTTIDLLREQLLIRAKVDPATSRPGGIDIAQCSSRKDPIAEPDTKKTETTIGLFTLSSTCERDDGLVITTRMRTVAGKDGIVRIIAITAKERSWTMNEDSFQEILNSIAQST